MQLPGSREKENRPALEGVLEKEHVVVVLPLALVGLGLLGRTLFFPQLPGEVYSQSLELDVHCLLWGSNLLT